MWLGHGCRQSTVAADRNVDPNGAGAGVAVRREQCKEPLSGFQEGCSSEEE